MEKRTFLRTMLDIFLNNNIVKTVVSIVNFCNEYQNFGYKKLKFSSKMPIKQLETSNYDNRFLFNGKMKVENGK